MAEPAATVGQKLRKGNEDAQLCPSVPEIYPRLKKAAQTELSEDHKHLRSQDETKNHVTFLYFKALVVK